jgi:D-alanyl-D-alanine carboxypeptidase
MSRRITRSALAVLCAAAAVPAQDLATKMDEYLQAYTKLNRFMGAALVARGGKIVLDKGYGYANLELKAPNTPDNKFRLGSITKQFTATAVMQLQESGKLSVNDPVCKYVESCPEAWKPITIHHLLTHTSGIPSYTGFPDFAKPKMMRMPLSPLEIVLLSKDKPLDFPPGEKWSYDNTGYVFLGYIIEKVSGEKYAAYLQNHIFGPLNMRDSGYDDTRAILPGRAAGYSRGPDGYLNADYLDMSLPHAAGSLYSTTGDLYRWDRALYTGKVLSKKSLDAMFTAVQNNYGYGWMVAPMANHKQIGHGGGINGFSTYIARFPDADAAVIVLANADFANAGALARGLAAILFGEKYELPREYKEVPIDPKILDRYPGTYQSPRLAFAVTKESGRLFVQATGQPKFEVYPYAENKFFLKVVEATIEFGPAGAERAMELILDQGAAHVVAKRVE